MKTFIENLEQNTFKAQMSKNKINNKKVDKKHTIEVGNSGDFFQWSCCFYTLF